MTGPRDPQYGLQLPGKVLDRKGGGGLFGSLFCVGWGLAPGSQFLPCSESSLGMSASQPLEEQRRWSPRSSAGPPPHHLTPTHSLAGPSGSPTLSTGPAMFLASLGSRLPIRAMLVTRWLPSRSCSFCIFLSPPLG